MHFNPKALLVLAALGLLIAVSLTSTGWARAVEAIATVFIALNLFAFFRDGRRTR